MVGTNRSDTTIAIALHDRALWAQRTATSAFAHLFHALTKA
jgi:hypothetical protein